LANQKSLPSEETAASWDSEGFENSDFFSLPTIFWKRDLVASWGVFDERFQFAFAYEYFMRIRQSVDFHFADGPQLAASCGEPAREFASEVPCREEFLDVACRYSRSLGPVYRHLKALARCRAAVNGSTLSKPDDSNRDRDDAYRAWFLVYAEKFQIPLNGRILAELGAGPSRAWCKVSANVGWTQTP
jgi:hypothetical protein